MISEHDDEGFSTFHKILGELKLFERQRQDDNA